MPPAIHQPHPARGAYQALHQINWEPLLQLSYAADRFWRNVRAPDPRHHNPAPDETVRFDKPNACTQCHQGWSVNRAIAETQRLWPQMLVANRSGGERFDEPEGRRSFLAMRLCEP